ncbi:MAG: response regulator [Planctomycetes bacterium]|nr:response regulator [Planctomycetota bacterium]
MSNTPHEADSPDPQERLAAALEAAGHGVWHWNLADRAAWYSQSFRRLLGYDRNEFPDRFETFASHVHPDDIGRVHHAVAAHLEGKFDFDLDFRLRAKDGSWKRVRARGRAIVEDGKSTAMMGTLTEWPQTVARDRLAASASDQLAAALHDQSQSSRELEQARADLLRQNQALQEARSLAEAATLSKSMFLANMSHEIRTPMTAILGFVDLLSEEQTDAKERAFITNAIRRNSKHLLTIINDILDLSKIEASGMGVEIIPCSALGAIQEVIASMHSQAQERGLELFVELRSAIPESIETDPTRFRQILINLVGNAIKFTEHGGVKVSVDLVREPLSPRDDPDVSDAEPAAVRLRVEVTDTGMGIDDTQRQRLFKPFMQADASTTRRFGGTGLGLTISRRLARMLGGDITCRSEVGRGSVFAVEIGVGDLKNARMVSALPAQAKRDAESSPGAAAPAAAHSKGAPSISVLVAEDGVDNQRLIEHHLTRAGMKVTVAGNGREAVDLATAAQRQSRAPDVILMDMQMPVMDGYEATTKLRSQGWSGAIVAITAHAMRGDRERCVEAGCDDYLTKPIDRETLIQTVQRLARRPASGR